MDFNEIISGSKPTLVDFYAEWCGPCKAQAPILEQVKERMGDSVNIIKINVDTNQEVAARYNVRSIPTLIVFANGEALWRASGLQQGNILEAKLREHLPAQQ